LWPRERPGADLLDRFSGALDWPSGVDVTTVQPMTDATAEVGRMPAAGLWGLAWAT